jgi:hypothetical protein
MPKIEFQESGMPSKKRRHAKKAPRFLDLDASCSGSASEDEEDDVENEDDLNFLDDSDQIEEPIVPRVKIRKSEKRLDKNELRDILEGAGVIASTVSDKKKRKRITRGGKKSKRIYKDDDDDGWVSEDKGFIASSEDEDDDDDDSNDDDGEKAGAHVQKLIRDYVRHDGNPNLPSFDLEYQICSLLSSRASLTKPK